MKLFGAGISLASYFNPKAKLWTEGRKDIIPRLRDAINGSQPVIWMHCASLGEFEQGRPVLEELRKKYPQYKYLLTFFSPSGYEIRKSYDRVDWVFYLPLDTPGNVKSFLDIVRPSLAIFVKYEYWYNYLNELDNRRIPAILISAIFRKNQVFFKWFGGLHKKMLGFFGHIFVQDEESRALLSGMYDEQKVTLAGDTRFDRVAEIASAFQPIDLIEKITKNRMVLVAGSTWPEDEKNLVKVFDKFSERVLLIIAPHEINDTHIKFLNTLFPEAILYSDLVSANDRDLVTCGIKILIINNIGILSKLYYYSHISYIGGGFNKSGIHNTLEAAIYGKPVIFGPVYEHFAEAVSLINNGGGFSYKNDNQLIDLIKLFINDEEKRVAAGKSASDFVKSNTGASHLILAWIRKNVF